MMRKSYVWSLILSLLIVFNQISPLWAESSHLPVEGGISNEYDYEEYVFLTGTPILMKGSVKVSISSGRGDTTTTKLTYKLTGANDDDKLTRSLTYVEMSAEREDKNQTVRTSQVDKFSESLTLGGTSYQLEDYRLSKSVIVDKHPVVNYYSGNWEGRKIYSVNRNEGRLTMEISGKTVGYDHNWGRSETQRMTALLQYVPAANGNGDPWDGQVDYAVNLSTDRQFSYHANDPVNISFSGGYLLSEQGSSALLINYDLPIDTTDNHWRDQGRLQSSLQTSPKVQRMYVPNYEDMRNHWALSAINRLSGLKAWSSQSGFFGPAQPITRLDFTKAYVQSLGAISPEGPSGMIAYTAGYPNLPEPGEKAAKLTQSGTGGAFNGATGTPRNKGAQTGEASPFLDVPKGSVGFEEVKLAYANKLLSGVSQTRFEPNGLLTREQAATIVVRGLGLTSLAPSGRVPLPFYDDLQISSWARESVYVAQEMGILSGDSYGYFRPKDVLTRAEAAIVIIKSIEFLQNDLRQDYRDRILSRH